MDFSSTEPSALPATQSIPLGSPVTAQVSPLPVFQAFSLMSPVITVPYVMPPTEMFLLVPQQQCMLPARLPPISVRAMFVPLAAQSQDSQPAPQTQLHFPAPQDTIFPAVPVSPALQSQQDGSPVTATPMPPPALITTS